MPPPPPPASSGRPPALSTLERRAPPPPPGVPGRTGPVSASPPPIVIVAMSLAAVALIVVGCTAYWYLNSGSVPPSPVHEVEPAEQPPEPAAPAESTDGQEEVDEGAAEPSAAPDGVTDTSDAVAPDEDKACKSSKDCAEDELCFDGVCEGDD